MCGISGFIDFKKRSTRETLVKMTDSLTHRGPDSSGYQVFESTNLSIGLGHRRLSVIDLSQGGAQPMSFHNKHIVFNGEIYNYREIKKELEGFGRSFKSNSDTEVLLQAYDQWGTDCFSKLAGMFAFVIFDEQANEVICVRDRVGVKPFFYYLDDGICLFASELKAFHEHSQFKKQLDHDSVAAFIQLGFVPSPKTIFKRCSKLQPAHYLIYDLTNKNTKLEKYWDVESAYLKPKLDLSPEEAILELESKLLNAFQLRLISDVPIGIFLSGGYDSALLTALLQSKTNTKLNTYTVSVPDIGLNEGPFAKKIAQTLGTVHHEFECTQKQALELLADLPTYFDEPLGDSSALPTSLLCKIVRKESKVILSADGGDELFAGYNRYDVLMKYSSLLNFKAGIANKAGMFFVRNFFSGGADIYSGKYTRGQKMMSMMKDPSVDNIVEQLNIVYTADQLKQVFHPNFQFTSPKYHHPKGQKQDSALSYMMCADLKTYLPDDILQKVDRASMAYGLEAREPYLDHRLIEFAAQLPDDMKYHKGVKKYILRELTHRYIPKELMERNKMGFAIPIGAWLKNDLRYLIDDYLSPQKISRQGVFNELYITNLKQRFLQGDDDLTRKLWYHIVFQMWYEKWM